MMVILILGTVIGGVGAAWYWYSEPLTFDLEVLGHIEATTNFALDDLIGITTYEELEGKCVNEMLHSNGHYTIRVAAKGGNPADVLAKLTVDMSNAGSSTCTAECLYGTWINGAPVAGSGTSLGPIETDGSQSIQINSGSWFLESDYSTGTVNVLYFRMDIDWDPSLPIGTYQISAIVDLGDS